MPNHTIEVNKSNVQWSGDLLDRLIAPEFSSLKSVPLPDVPELPNYYGSFFRNNVLQSPSQDKSRPLVFAMLRHLTQAIRDYQSGSKALAEFGVAKSHSNDAVTLYLRALTQFEQAIIHSDLAVGLSYAIERCLIPSSPKNHFKHGEDTAEERLRFLYNGLKHFDRTVGEGKLPDRATPVWMVSEGLKGVFEQKKGGPTTVKTLLFSELAEILVQLTSNAKFLAEDVYRLAHERKAAKKGEDAAQTN